MTETPTTAPTLAEIARAAQAREAARHVIYLVGTDRVGVLPREQAELVVTLAEDLRAQRDKMTRQADRLDALLTFSDRLRDAMAAAAGSAVRLDVSSIEEQIANFLLTQARARAALVDRTRYRHSCRICGMTTLSNPEYEKVAEHKRKVSAATRGLGLAFLSGGAVSPIVMTNSLFAFRTQKSDYHCPRCQAQDTDQSVIVFCPQCKAQYDGALLKRCPKCGYDFTSVVDLTDVWQPTGSVSVPAPTGNRVGELRLDDVPSRLAFFPDGRHLLSASWARLVQAWDLGDGQTAPHAEWSFAAGGMVKASQPIVALSPDGRLVATGKPQTPRIRLLRAVDGTEVGGMVWALADAGSPSHVAFAPDSSALVISNSYVEIWDLSGTRRARMKLGALIAPAAVACSPDGAYIVAAAGTWSTNKLFVWRPSDCAQLARLNLPGAISDLAWTPYPGMLALAVGQEAWVIEVPSGRQVSRFSLDAQVTGVAVSRDGRHLAAASQDHSARVFDLTTRAEVVRISRPGAVTAVAFGPDGRLAVGDDTNAVQFWSARPPE